jgi:hypothetical protein
MATSPRRNEHPPDDRPKVTLAHLRGAEAICPRRLAREHADNRGNWGANVRWLTANRVLDDIRLAHTDLTAPRPDHFRATADLTPEQASVYALATRWYVTLFADRPVRAVDEDAWSTDHPDGFRLVGPAGLGVTGEDGSAEIRLLQLSAWADGGPGLLESPAVRFALLRRPAWLDGRPVRVANANLALGTYDGVTVDTGRARPVLDEWLAKRVAAIRDRIAEPEPQLGLQCGRCAYIAGCPALR